MGYSLPGCKKSDMTAVDHVLVLQCLLSIVSNIKQFKKMI